MKYKKSLLNWLLAIIWAIVIFVMSGMDTNESNTKSKGTLNKIVEKTVETTNGLGITDKYPSEKRMKEFIDKYNYLFRKIAHASEYFILTILLFIALKSSGVKGKKTFIVVLLFCFIYACTDEIHQLFVIGRTSSFIDVLIDTSGSFTGIMIIYILGKRRCKNENNI